MRPQSYCKAPPIKIDAMKLDPAMKTAIFVATLTFSYTNSAVEMLAIRDGNSYFTYGTPSLKDSGDIPFPDLADLKIARFWISTVISSLP
jgi:hypothetical protein